MPRVRRSVKQKVIVAAAVAALLTGAALAAVSATGQGNPRRSATEQRAKGRSHALAPAAAYLGISVQQLSSELSSGKTLAQVADSRSGKSASGLVAALLAAKQAKLAHAASTLPKRVNAEVNRAGGPRSAIAGRGVAAAPRSRLDTLFSAPASPGRVAASYLGLAPSQLKAELQSGKTLALLAGATPGKSKAGLVDALVASREKRRARAASAGQVSRARLARRRERLRKHANMLVERRFAGA
jgi:hypothetical protein